jgi:hypothetical protein
MNDEKAYKGCAWALMGLIALSVALNVWLLTRGQVEPSVVVEHDTLWRDTTIYKPVAADSQKTGETVFIRIPYPVPTPGDTVHDSISVPIPIEQKRYDDSLYTAWVSGFRPALDSIRIYHPEITTTITKTIVQKAPRLSLGLSVGPGVSIDRDHHMGIYVGFTANYRLWPK